MAGKMVLGSRFSVLGSQFSVLSFDIRWDSWLLAGRSSAIVFHIANACKFPASLNSQIDLYMINYIFVFLTDQIDKKYFAFFINHCHYFPDDA